MTPSEYKNVGFGVVVIAAAACLPFASDAYLLTIGVTVMMYTVLSTSWALFSGPTHYISLATAAFFGLGTYTTALGIENGLNYWVTLPLAAVLGALVAGLVGLATLRLSGVYFVIFTLGLSELIRQLVTWIQNISGQKGLYVLTEFDEADIYWQLLALAALVFVVGWLIGRSRLGFALRIIGDDDEVARHSGINTARAKILLFMVSGAFASVVGGVLAPRYIYIEPSIAFTPMLSFLVVIMALLGGVGRLWGPIVGVIPFTILWEALSASFPNQTTLMLGFAFLLIVFLLPKGFVGLVTDISGKLKKRGAFA